MSQAIRDRMIREIRRNLFETGDRLPSDMLKVEFMQILLKRYDPGLSLDSLLPGEELESGSAFRTDRRNYDQRRLFFYLLRFILLKTICATDHSEEIAGALVFIYLCSLDRPFEEYDSTRTETSFVSQSQPALQEYLDNLMNIVDQEINSLLPEGHRLRFPDLDSTIFRGFSKTSIGKYLARFMATLRPNIVVASEAASGVLQENVSPRLTRKTPEAGNVKAAASNPQKLQILPKATAHKCFDLVAPPYQKAWEVGAAQWADQPVPPIMPVFNILGRLSPVKNLPELLYLPPILHPVSFGPIALQPDESIAISMEDLISGPSPYQRAMILGEPGSGRTTLARRLGAESGANPPGGNPLPFVLHIDCEQPTDTWLQQSPYVVAADMLRTQQISLTDSPSESVSLIEKLSQTGQIVWVLDNLFEEGGKLPIFLRTWAATLGKNSRIILIPGSQNRDFLGELLATFFPIPSISSVQPLTIDQQQTLIAHYAEEAAQGYLPGGEIREFADGLVEQEKCVIQSASPLWAGVLRIQRAAESERSYILNGLSRMENLPTRQIQGSVTLNTPLAALSYCMDAEMGKCGQNDGFLLLLFVEQAGLLNYPENQPLIFPWDEPRNKESMIRQALGIIATQSAGRSTDRKTSLNSFSQTELDQWLAPIPWDGPQPLQSSLLHTRIIRRSYSHQDWFEFTYLSFQTILAKELIPKTYQARIQELEKREER